MPQVWPEKEEEEEKKNVFLNTFKNHDLHFFFPNENTYVWVPIVAQWLTNLTRNHEVGASIPGLAQGVKYPALP